MSYRNARTPDILRRNEEERMLLFQWHNGTDSRQDALPDGGWEAEVAKYPGLKLGLKTGFVQHSNSQVEAWIADALTIAVLDHRLTWHTWDKATTSAREPLGQIVNLTKWEAGAWSRLRVLAWVGEIDQPAVLTMKGTISADFMEGLETMKYGPLAQARKSNPDLALCAFWLTVSAGPREKRGKVGAASWITPPVFDLPATTDQAEIDAWLEARFVGQDLLDTLATQAPALLERFRSIGHAKRQEAEPADRDPEPPANPRPEAARCAHGHIYDAAQYGDACPVCIDEEAQAKAAFLAAQAARPANGADGFDGLQRAVEDPAIQAALAEAERKAANRAPAMPAAASSDVTPHDLDTLTAYAGSLDLDISKPQVARIIDAAVKSKSAAAYQAAAKTLAGLAK